MPTARSTMHTLAAAFLSGRWNEDDLVDRGCRALGKRPRWLRPLVRRIFSAFGEQARPRIRALAMFIAEDSGYRRARRRRGTDGIVVATGIHDASVMSPCAGRPATWTVPPLCTPGALVEWLELTPGQLDWFADCQARERNLPAGPLRHYLYRWVPKRSGGMRLIETPKTRLKALQRRLLHDLLDVIPPHDCAHGFCRRRSIRSFVDSHLAQRVVLRVDLQDFFTSIGSPRVINVFLTAGYPEPVAILLAGLCTNSVPADLGQGEGYAIRGDEFRRREALRWPHLPQGSPTSPALANLCAYRLDCRLQGLARSANAQYTRYADDLLFSGGREFERSVRRFQIHVAAIAIEEGFRVHPRKTRSMRQSVRQHAAGVVINERPNVRRSDYDQLKATLHNCVRHGPAAQNRDRLEHFSAHLAGRVAHVAMLNPTRGARLQALFDRIAW